MRFSRHAKNRMRLYGRSRGEIAEIVAAGTIKRFDEAGRPIFVGRGRDGQLVEVVMALDAPNFVVTVFGEKKR